MKRGDAAFGLTGIPVAHGPAFQFVADRTGHVIIGRDVGAHCTRLLLEGYATKGFRIDTKSCNWGPMRGFVCVDPRLSKVVGNPSPGLKKTLSESMPLIAFLPGAREAWGIETETDFRALVRAAQGRKIAPDLRPEWSKYLR